MWANFDVNFNIGVSSEWLRSSTAHGPAIIRVRNSVGLTTYERASQLVFDHSDDNNISTRIERNQEYQAMTSSTYPALTYSIEGVLASHDTVPVASFSIGPEPFDKYRLQYAQVDIIWSCSIAEKDWRIRTDSLKQEGIEIFNLFIHHYRCMSGDIDANPQDHSKVNVRLKALKPGIVSCTDTHDDLLRMTQRLSDFRGMNNAPESPVVSMTFPKVQIPYELDQNAVQLLNQILASQRSYPLHWDTLITAYKELTVNENIQTAVIVGQVALEWC